jgi:tetratricopeptide (TPR) repeat protein
MKLGMIGGDFLPQMLLTLSQCYAQMGQLDRQQQAIEALLEINPKYPEGLLTLANIHLALGRDDEAASVIDNQVRKILDGEKFFKVPAAVNLKLEIENRRQLREPESKRDWTKVDRLLDVIVKYSGPNLNPLALTLMKVQNQQLREKPEEARKLVDAELRKHNATQLDDSTRQPLLILALADCSLIAQEKGPAEALTRLDDIQARFGDSLTIRQRRATLLVQRGGPTVAQELAKLEENVPQREQVATWKMLAGFYEMIRSPDDARRLYEQVLKQQTHDLPTHFALFELAYRTDDEERMVEAVKNVEQLCGRESSERSYLEAKRLIRLASKSEETADRVYDQARTLLKQVQAERPKWHVPVALLAEIAFREDDVTSGLKLMEESLRLGPANAQSVSILVQLYGRQGDMAGARRAINRLRESERTPDLRKVAARLELMSADREQGRKEALRQAAEIMSDLEKGAVSSNDYLWHAHLLTQCGMPKEATEAYRKAVKRNSQDEAAWITYVQHLAAQRDFVQAGDAIREAELALPEDRLPIIAAQCFALVGKFGDAERLYAELLQADPDNTMLLRAMTGVQMNKNDVRATVRYLDRLIGLGEKAPATDTNVAWARRAKAELLAKSGDYANFKKACELIQRNYVDGKPSLIDLAMEADIFAKRREKEYVDKAIEKIVAIRKDRGVLPVNLQFALARLYNQSGDWEKCQEELRSLYPRTKQTPEILAGAIDLFLDHNELNNAESRLEDLRKLQENSFEYVRRQARFLALAGKPQQAVAALSRFVPQGPDASLTDEQITAIRAVGLELENMKQYDAAEKLLRRSAAIRTSERLVLAGFLARRGGVKRVQEAIDICEPEIKRGVRYDLILQVAAEATRPGIDKPRPTDKQIEQLAAWYDKAENSDRSSVHFQLRKAEFLDLRGLHSKAAEIYRELLGRPDLDKQQRGLVLNNLAFLLVVSDGNLDEAIQHIVQSIDILGPSSDLRDTRGLIYWRRDDNKSAMDDLHQAVQGGASATKYFHRALGYQQGKNLEAAAKDLKEAHKLRLNKDDLSAKEREWLAQLENELKQNRLLTSVDVPATK